jgi:hypothetical protein
MSGEWPAVIRNPTIRMATVSAPIHKEVAMPKQRAIYSEMQVQQKIGF